MGIATLAALTRQRSSEALVLDDPLALDDVPTPALLLDRAALDRNIARMRDFLASHDKGVRPHTKTHKCPLIARAQLAAGAVGVCAAKVSEAVVMCAAGVSRVLITSPVTTPEKATVVAELAEAAEELLIVVDSMLGVECLETALAGAAQPLGVLIDLDPHMGRTGVRTTDDALALAERLAASDVLELRGVQHYAGHVMHIEGHAARAEASLGHWRTATETIEALRARGHRLAVVSGCGTGTYDIDCGVDAVTDLQVGSYVFMDQEYLNIGSATGPVNDDFETSLTVLATAISQPAQGAITVDCGYKGFASETVAPECLDVPETKFVFAGDEHGVLLLGAGNQQPLLGHKLRFVTPHCDPTVNLYDYYWVHGDGYVQELWPISARGCSW